MSQQPSQPNPAHPAPKAPAPEAAVQPAPARPAAKAAPEVVPVKIPARKPEKAPPPNTERGGVIDLKTRVQGISTQIGKIRKPSRKWLKHWLRNSALLAIALPTVIASVYFGLIASDQYVTESQFAVRGSDGGTSPDILGVITGFSSSSSSTSSDSFILQQYIHSREMVDKLQNQLDLRTIFTSPEADFFSRLSGSATTEELVNYWRSMTKVSFDATSGILTVAVRAYTPEESQKLGAAVLESSENLINNLSRRAREDGVRYSKEELSRSELRLKFARQAIRDFRDREQSLDPSKTAESRLGILSKLEGELANAEAELAGVASFLSSDAPSVKVLNNRIGAIKQQIVDERSKIGGSAARAAQGQNVTAAGKVLSGVISEYEELAVEREFAEKAYVTSLAAVERARMEAERQVRYVTTFVQPKLADEALYPLRLQSVLIVFLIAGVLWAMGVLLFYAVRDHAM